MVEAPARAASKYLSGLFASQKALPDCKGTRLTSNRPTHRRDFSMSLEGDRRESTDEESPEHALMLRGSMRW